jgi:hypothetical protein
MRLPILIVAAVLAACPAFAHESKGPNGGRITDLGPFHAELVAKNNVVDLYLTDTAEKAVAAAGYKGVAILSVRGKTERVVLEPAGSNRLTGASSVPLSINPKGVVRLTTPDGKTNQAKFD